jgi:hypothetical protein
MSMSNAAVTATESTKYTLIWGFLMNQSHQNTERFEGDAGRAACWERVQAVMSLRGCPRNYGPSHPVCLLQVYTTEADGTRTRSDFKPHTAGSRFIKWTDAHGQGWAVDVSNFNGASCG